MTWYFQYVLARDIAAAREAEASRSNTARQAKARSDENTTDDGLRRRAAAPRGMIAAIVASLAAQTRRVVRRVDVQSAGEFEVPNVTRMGRECDAERA